MTRTDYEQSVANKLGIISALKDNVGDEFSALEISAAMVDPPDLKPLQIGAVLKSMVAEGLVSKRPSKNMNVYRLTKKALAWTPPPYDRRAEGAMATPPESAAEPVTAKPPTAGKVNGTPVLVPPATPARRKPKPPVTKPADDHPWVHPPAVLPSTPKASPVTRPLPAHLHTRQELISLALEKSPVAPEAGCQGSPDDSIHSAMQKDMQNNHAPMPTESREDEPLAESPAVISVCDGKGECGGHCANHARASELDDIAEAQVARLAAQLSDAQSALADVLSDLAVARRERDLLRQQLRERARHEQPLLVEGLMELLRLALLRIPHPGESGYFANVGNRGASEAQA